MPRPQRTRKPSAHLRFLQAQEEEWEAHQAELARTAGERRKARKQREREKAQKQEKKKTKKTKAAAKGGIKKPLTAYMFFSLENREDIKAENPDADFGTIAAIVGNEWRALTPDDKEYYQEKARRDKKRYERALAGGAVPVAAAAPRAPARRSKPVEFAPPSSYAEYCAEAIGALRERTGSSYMAIEKYITANHAELDFKRHHFRNALKRGAAKGDFIKVKASFKLSPAMKKRWYR